MRNPSPRLKLIMELLLVGLIMVLISGRAKAQSKPLPITVKLIALFDSQQLPATTVPPVPPTTTDPVIAGAIERKALNMPVPPTLGSTPCASTGTGVRQTIVFTPRGNTRLVTTIRIR